MATNTAQILIGKSHPYDGGITNLTYSLYLSENSNPAWRLTPFNDTQNKKEFVWIPTLEHMLEDALLMIGLYVIQDKDLLESYNSLQTKKDTNRLSLYEDFKAEELNALREITKKVKFDGKLLISVFNGSTILRQLLVLKNYQMNVEVCVSQFVNEQSIWTNQREKHGSLGNSL